MKKTNRDNKNLLLNIKKQIVRFSG